ncbi:MAG: type II toxin-antitoxin system HicB family antitoxin [Acidobacteriota bacterium]
MKQRFLVVYEHGKRNYSGFAPDIPGCFSTGKTLAQMRQMLREALESHLQWMANDGDPLPAPKTRSVEFTDEDLSAADPEHYFIVESLDLETPGTPVEREEMTA